MARPIKEGLTYFPLDVEMDEKVEAIEAVHGMNGFGLYIKLLQEAYKKHDGRIPINADNLFSIWKILRKRTGLEAETIIAIVNDMITVGLFDKDEYASGSLTSSGIQKRIEEVNKKRSKDRIYHKKGIKNNQHRKPPDNSAKTGESKVKEIKENQRKEKINAPEKLRYGDDVLLTVEEYEKLIIHFNSEDRTKAAIKILDNYIGSSGRKYKSHYKTILGWVTTELEKREKQNASTRTGNTVKQSEQVARATFQHGSQDIERLRNNKATYGAILDRYQRPRPDPEPRTD